MKATPGARRRRAAIFFWEGHLAAAPSLLNAARALAGAGYQVDVIVRSLNPIYGAPPRLPAGVRVVVHRRDEPAVSPAASPPRGDESSHWWARVKPGLRCVAELLAFAIFCLRQTRAARYDFFLGADVMGVIPATLAGIVRRAPVVYWSLELAFLAELSEWDHRLLKRLERFCSRRALVTVIQDRARADALVSENGLSPARIVLVPNGPYGQAPRRRGRHFAERFGLPEETRLILQLGMIGPATLAWEVAEQAGDWPEEWALVMHDRQRLDPAEPYLRHLLANARGRLRLSLNPVPYDELDELVSSAHVGLVFYEAALGPNFALAGSSGKIGAYLRCGLPVVCLDLPGLAQVVRAYDCGVVVAGVAETASAVRTILGNYDYYAERAARCYEEVYEFGANFDLLLSRIRRRRGLLSEPEA